MHADRTRNYNCFAFLRKNNIKKTKRMYFEHFKSIINNLKIV